MSKQRLIVKTFVWLLPTEKGSASKLMVAKFIDEYLAEIVKDPNLPLSNFFDLAELVSGIFRPAHDGRALQGYSHISEGNFSWKQNSLTQFAYISL